MSWPTCSSLRTTLLVWTSVTTPRRGRIKGRRKIAGELFIGNERDGSFTIDFEATLTKGVEGTLEFHGTPHDLKAGRCFVVKPRGIISQLPCQTKDEALALLSTRQGE